MESAVGGSASAPDGSSYGVFDVSFGTINVATATGGTAYTSYGVYNNIGTVNANAAIGGNDVMNVYESWGVYNASSGTVNVMTAALSTRKQPRPSRLPADTAIRSATAFTRAPVSQR